MQGREVLRPCLSTGGLCCFVLLQLDQALSHYLNRPHPSSVRPSVCLAGFTFAVNCLCFLSFFLPLKHYSLSLQHFDISVSHSFSLLLSFSSSHSPSSSSSSSSLPLVSLWLPPYHLPPPRPFAVLWRPTEAIRTDGLRWFPGSTHFYRKQPGTAAGMMLSQGVCRSNNTDLIQSARLKALNDPAWGGFWHHFFSMVKDDFSPSC